MTTVESHIHRQKTATSRQRWKTIKDFRPPDDVKFVDSQGHVVTPSGFLNRNHLKMIEDQIGCEENFIAAFDMLCALIYDGGLVFFLTIHSPLRDSYARYLSDEFKRAITGILRDRLLYGISFVALKPDEYVGAIPVHFPITGDDTYVAIVKDQYQRRKFMVWHEDQARADVYPIIAPNFKLDTEGCVLTSLSALIHVAEMTAQSERALSYAIESRLLPVNVIQDMARWKDGAGDGLDAISRIVQTRYSSPYMTNAPTNMTDLTDIVNERYLHERRQNRSLAYPSDNEAYIRQDSGTDPIEGLSSAGDPISGRIFTVLPDSKQVKSLPPILAPDQYVFTANRMIPAIARAIGLPAETWAGELFNRYKPNTEAAEKVIQTTVNRHCAALEIVMNEISLDIWGPAMPVMGTRTKKRKRVREEEEEEPGLEADGTTELEAAAPKKPKDDVIDFHEEPDDGPFTEIELNRGTDGMVLHPLLRVENTYPDVLVKIKFGRMIAKQLEDHADLVQRYGMEAIIGWMFDSPEDPMYEHVGIDTIGDARHFVEGHVGNTKYTPSPDFVRSMFKNCDCTPGHSIEVVKTITRMILPSIKGKGSGKTHTAKGNSSARNPGAKAAAKPGAKSAPSKTKPKAKEKPIEPETPSEEESKEPESSDL